MKQWRRESPTGDLNNKWLLRNHINNSIDVFLVSSQDVEIMIVLVDYENISVHHRHIGLKYIVDRVVRLLGLTILKSEQRILIRLYGGWYILNKLTRIAQHLSITIQEEFPRPMIILEGLEKHTITVGVELAYSLAINPSKHFWHTYRPRGFPNNLICTLPSLAGCTDPNCPLQIVYDFFNNSCCPKPNCDVKPWDILQKAEQKLVDTMLTADLIHYASAESKNLCLVTSDDDLWPAIITALFKGAHVIHIQTHSKRNESIFYSQGLEGNYTPKNL